MRHFVRSTLVTLIIFSLSSVSLAAKFDTELILGGLVTAKSNNPKFTYHSIEAYATKHVFSPKDAEFAVSGFLYYLGVALVSRNENESQPAKLHIIKYCNGITSTESNATECIKTLITLTTQTRKSEYSEIFYQGLNAVSGDIANGTRTLIHFAGDRQNVKKLNRYNVYLGHICEKGFEYQVDISSVPVQHRNGCKKALDNIIDFISMDFVTFK